MNKKTNSEKQSFNSNYTNEKKVAVEKSQKSSLNSINSPTPSKRMTFAKGTLGEKIKDISEKMNVNKNNRKSSEEDTEHKSLLENEIENVSDLDDGHSKSEGFAERYIKENIRDNYYSVEKENYENSVLVNGKISRNSDEEKQILLSNEESMNVESPEWGKDGMETNVAKPAPRFKPRAARRMKLRKSENP